MVYVMGSVYGNAKAYFSMKTKINLQESDQLYVLGNIFDGNDEHPEQCLIILEDIIKNDNVTLIVGEHEYWHLLYACLPCYNKKEQNTIKSKIQDMLPKTKPLKNFIDTLSLNRREYYFNYILSCQPHKIIRVKDQYYFLSSAYPPVETFYKDKTIKEKEYLWKLFDNPIYYYNADDFEGFVVALKKRLLSFEDKQIKYYEGLENAIVITSARTSLGLVEKINENKGPGYKKYNYSTLKNIPYGDYQRIIADSKNNISIDCGIDSKCVGNQDDYKLKPTLACLRIDDDNNITAIYKHNIYE